MTSKEALENITDWIEYFTRLDYVEPIVRGEVQKNFYEAYHKTRPELELIEKDLDRLKTIDNANPSEALKCLESLEHICVYRDTGTPFVLHFKEEFDTIKQALLKVQEQDKILEKLKRPLFYSEMKRLGEEYIEWAKENNALQDDLTNIITWCFCFKMKEWLNNGNSL